MKYRSYGSIDFKTSEIGHGTWAMGGMWGARNDREAIEALQHGLSRGINFIDTAWIYGEGHAESLVAKALAETRSKTFVATKCPPKNRAWPAKPDVPAEEVFPADYLIEMTERSLKNLRRDCLDLQQLHVWSDSWLEQGDWREAVWRLKREGKIRYFGVSLNDHQPDSGLRLVESGLADSVQVIYNFFDQSARNQLFPLCLEKKVGVIVRVPLDEGGLGGRLTPQTHFAKGDWRRHYFKGDRLEKTCARAQRFAFLLRRDIKTLAQAALKFCLAEAAVSTVAVGMRQLAHVEANSAISELGDLTPQELQEAYRWAWPRNFYPAYG